MRTAIYIGWTTIAVFFGGFGSWAALAPLDGAVVAPGMLAVHGNRKTVQHREGGIVQALFVTEGDHVARDQILIRLDDTQIRAGLRVHQAALEGDQALMARDLAEIAEAESISFPQGLTAQDNVAASVMARENTVFHNHRALLRQQLAVTEQRIVQVREQIEGTRAQYDAALRGLDLANQELHAFTVLLQRGLASHTHVLELARSVEGLRGDTGQLQAQMAQHGAERGELQAEELRLRAAAQQEATHELREAQLRVNDVLPRIAADQDMLAHLDIRAPVSGRVVDQTVFTTGGVVEPGKPLLDIVPANTVVVAEVDIKPEDIEYLRVGEPAQIVVTGFNPRQTRPLFGHIDVISADRVNDPRTGRQFYRAEVRMDADQEGGRLLKRLSPGMPVEVVVPIKPRTALDYLLEPLRNSFRQSGNEI
jgi:HlyD family type I secretion membrane fusion protein